MADRGTSVGKAYVQIMPSTEGIAGSISKALNGEADGAGRTLGGKLAGAIKGVLVTAGIGTAIGKSIKEGAALEQSLGGVETLFKDQADAVIKNADRAWKTAGLSANEYMEQSTSFAASLLQSLGGDTEAAAKYADMAIVDMADNANKMGTSIENIQNAYSGFAKQNYTMLDNLKLGYGGTKTEMERLLKDAEKLTGQKYDIGNLSDVYDAIHAVQVELDITGTTSKEAASTLSGSMAAMKSAATNFLGDLTLGRNVAPALKGLIEATSTFLFDNLIPAVGRVFASLPVAMGAFLKEGFPQLSTSLQTMLSGLADTFKGSGEILANAFAGMADFSKMLLADSGPLISAGLRLVENLAQGIASALPSLIENFPVIVSNIADIINNNAPKVLASGVKILKTLTVGIIKSIPVLVKNLPKIFSAMLKAWSAMNWINLGKLAINGLKKGIQGGVSAVVKAVKDIVAKIKSLWSFKLGKPHVPVPKFSITPLGWKLADLLKGIKPNLSVIWNAKGGIMDSPTLFGLAGGEAGPEGIVPLNPFWERLDSTLASMQAAKSSDGGGTVKLVINLDSKTIGQATVDYINNQTLMFGASPVML